MNVSDGISAAMDEWAVQQGCSKIDIANTSEFAAVWMWCLVYGISLVSCVTIPYCWCSRTAKKRQLLPSGLSGDNLDDDDVKEAEKIESPRRRQGEPEEDEEDFDHLDPVPNLQAAKDHLVRTSCTRDGRWLSMFSTPLSEISQIGGPGTELYFRLLRNMGFCFIFMAAITAPIPAFSSFGNFVPDNGQNLTLTTAGNLGAVSTSSLFPGDRYVIIKCQGLTVKTLTQLFGWLDFASVCTFLAFVCYFRFRLVPKVKRETAADDITTQDFSMEIDCLPRILNQDHEMYEQKLKNHVTNRAKLLRERIKGVKPTSECKACEVMLVRDYDGKLGDLKSRAEVQQKIHIAEYTHDEKGKTKLEKKLEKLEKRLERHLDEDALPVIRAYVIMNSPIDVNNMLHDYRFAKYGLLRCCQRRERQFEGGKLRVKRAPEPSNILWENQDLPFKWQVMRKLGVGLVCLLLIIVSFVLAFGFNSVAQSQKTNPHLLLNVDACDPKPKHMSASNQEDEYKCLWNATAWDVDWVRHGATKEEKNCYCGVLGYTYIFQNFQTIKDVCEDWMIQTGTGISIGAAAAGMVVGINVICKLALEALAHSEKPLSITQLNSSIIKKVAFTQTLNTGLVIFCVNFYPPEWVPSALSWIFQGDFSDAVRGWYGVVGAAILLNMASNVVVPSASNTAIMVLDAVKRKCCAGRRKHQAQLLELFTNPEFNIAARFAQVLTTVMVTMMYSAGMPLLNLFAALFMFFMYWADKYVLLSGSKRPPAYDTSMAKQCSQLLLYAVPLHLVFAIWMYGQPCTFPSEPFGLMAATVDQYGAGTVAGGASFFERASLKSTWMLYSMLVCIVGLWVVWLVMWILGSTVGEALKCFQTVCCPRRAKTVPDDVGDKLYWDGPDGAKEFIDNHCPPASYRMEKSPAFKLLAPYLRDTPVTPKRTPTPTEPKAEPHVLPYGRSAEVYKGPVDMETAQGFVNALRHEYVEGKAEAVGLFFQASGVSRGDQEKLAPFENRIREATDKRAGIDVLVASWNLVERKQTPAASSSGTRVESVAPEDSIAVDALNEPSREREEVVRPADSAISARRLLPADSAYDGAAKVR
eukprot:CAMPEP_0195065124 /NCGR_PEP_ID=MMETSP0448-20130528/10874_1 /TAXON_ID=66468 /ORGANISM="Heterocapsa triquestra, Strain CCMP 448" /LENGTH=1089 /DNA_ID=CAMNT_0040096191 /DNA_START=40 /DNA_END=3310 /DNA_ORIENTATION=+